MQPGIQAGEPVRAVRRVVVVLEDGGVRAVVRVHGRRDVPTEVIRRREPAGTVELHQVAAEAVVGIEGAVEHAAVRQGDRGGGGGVRRLTGGRQVGGRVDAGGGAG